MTQQIATIITLREERFLGDGNHEESLENHRERLKLSSERRLAVEVFRYITERGGKFLIDVKPWEPLASYTPEKQLIRRVYVTPVIKRAGEADVIEYDGDVD